MINISTPGWKIENVEALFFDKDGTLVDSHIYWGRVIEKRSQALIELLKLDPSEYVSLCQCMGFSLSTRRLLPEGPVGLVSRERVIEILCDFLKKRNMAVSKEEITKLFIEVHLEFLKEIYGYIKLLPGVIELMKKIKSKNVKTALITSDSIKNTKEIVRYLKLEKYFDLLIGKEASIEPKVTGRPALIALESLGVDAGHTVCVGDAPLDIIMSRNASLKACIGVALGQVSFGDLLKETQYVVNDYSELSVE